jgi:DNA-binding SARP family transcriptional activator
MFQLVTLGAFELRLQDGCILPKPATLKSQSLLVYLVCHPTQSHPREQLIGMFWGDRPERKARRSLSTALWHIRRILPDDALILSDTANVCTNQAIPFQLDAQTFADHAARTAMADLHAAAALYRGPFLEGFYDEWVVVERYRLESLYVDVLARLMAGYETSGAYQPALTTALQLIEQDPLREDARRMAMRTYCHLGQRNAALMQYRQCQQVLQAELGVEPMGETRDLWHTIRDGRFVRAPQVAATPAVVLNQRAAGYNPLDATARAPLIGRERELEFLAEAWQAALANQCSLVLISGEAGIGKTRLVQTLADQQQWRGMRILQGRCFEFERLVSYQPFAEILRAIPDDLTNAALAELPPWMVTQINRLTPERASYPSTLTPSATDVIQQTQLFESINQFLIQLSTRAPILLVLEDLHWATDSVLQLLHYLARQLITQPLLIVGTLRPEAVAPAHPLATVGRRLDRDGLARRLQLERLSQAAVAQLIRQMSGDGAAAQTLAERLYQETEGNPFYLIEMVKALFEQGMIRLESGVWRADFDELTLPLPATVEETIQARFGRLSPPSQNMARVAAVVGKTFDYELLQQAAGQDEATTLDSLDDLLRHRLIGEASDGDFAFTHHKLQEVVYQALPQHRRLLLHGQVATAMEIVYANEVDDRTAELAYHFEQAALLNVALGDKAVTYLQQAGDRATQSHAHQEAIAFFRRALRALTALPTDAQSGRSRHPTSAELHERLADAHNTIGDVEQAQTAYATALSGLPASERILQGRIYYKLAAMLDWSEMEEAWRMLESAESALGDDPLEPEAEWWEMWLYVQMRWAMLHYWRRDASAMQVQIDKIELLMEEHSTLVQQVGFYGLLGNHGFVVDRYVPTSRTVEYCQASLAAARKVADPYALSNAQFRLGFAYLWLDRLDEAEVLIQASLAYATKVGVVNNQLLCKMYLTYLYRKRGSVVQTEQLATECLTLAHKVGAQHYVVAAHGALAWVAWREGKKAQAAENGQIAVDIWQQEGTPKMPLLWTAIWPLMGVALVDSNLTQAITFVPKLLDPNQQRLPDDMSADLEAALTAWENDEHQAAQHCLEQAATIAKERGFL